MLEERQNGAPADASVAAIEGAASDEAVSVSTPPEDKPLEEKKNE